MSFSAEWLALREPHDRRARNVAVLDAVAAYFADYPSVSVVDLACGTGSTLRAVSARLPARQTWRLVDNDLSLLARAGAGAASDSVSVRTEPVDLARDLELALDGHVDLVTNSALFDLVSDEWLERFTVEAAARELPVYAAIIYDGRVAFEPGLPSDAEVIEAVNRHQRTDKGFGAALGPDAKSVLTRRFARLDYNVDEGVSDWTFGPQDSAIQKEVVSGWAAAARDIGTVPLDRLVRWMEERQAAIADGRSSIRVGHADVFARPKIFR